MSVFTPKGVVGENVQGGPELDSTIVRESKETIKHALKKGVKRLRYQAKVVDDETVKRDEEPKPGKRLRIEQQEDPGIICDGE